MPWAKNCWWCCGVFVLLVKLVSSAGSMNSLGDTWRQCLTVQPYTSLGHCLGQGTISRLQSWDSDPQFDLVDGLTLTKDQKEFREEAFNFAERDPGNFRTIVDSLAHVFTKRSIQWDMGFLYPGLAMRIAPSTSPAGVLEFVMDPHREALNNHAYKEIGTGQLLARQFVLPLLLGFKFNVATIVPILFGILALLAKKAVFISKIALVVSSAFGLGTLLLGNENGNKPTESYVTHHAPGLNPGFGGHYRFPATEEHPDVVYRGVSEVVSETQFQPVTNNGADQYSKGTEQFRSLKEGNSDQIRLYGNLNLRGAYDRDGSNKGRNFAWNEDEKKLKPA